VAFALHKINLEEEHERAEINLYRSEKRYRALFDSATDAIFLRDLDGNIIIANAAMAELSGYSTKELTGMKISAILAADRLKTTASPSGTNRNLFPQRRELRLTGKDGTVKTVEVVSSLLEEGERTIVQSIARDITFQKQAQENLRYYANQAIVAQEEERKRIARELHDDTAQALASLGMDIGALIKNRKSGPVRRPEELEALRTKTEAILEGVRALSRGMRPPMLEEFGLLAALKGLVNELKGQLRITASFDVRGTPRRLTPDAQIAIYRIAQEALSNVRKHGEAGECSLLVTYSPRKVVLEISDDGHGFTPPEPADNLAYSGRLGLAGMQERAKLIGGRLSVKSRPGRGTVVRLDYP
jgi:PAS domain S-box-containing protein